MSCQNKTLLPEIYWVMFLIHLEIFWKSLKRVFIRITMFVGQTCLMYPEISLNYTSILEKYLHF